MGFGAHDAGEGEVLVAGSALCAWMGEVLGKFWLSENFQVIKSFGPIL